MDGKNRRRMRRKRPAAGRHSYEAGGTAIGRLSFGIFQQSVRKIPRPVHDALDAKGVACHVEEQVTVEWPFHLDTLDVGEFRSPEATTTTQARPFGDAFDRFMHGQQVTLGYVRIGVFQIPPILQGDVLFRPQGDGYFQAHAFERALLRIRSKTAAS